MHGIHKLFPSWTHFALKSLYFIAALKQSVPVDSRDEILCYHRSFLLPFTPTCGTSARNESQWLVLLSLAYRCFGGLSGSEAVCRQNRRWQSSQIRETSHSYFVENHPATEKLVGSNPSLMLADEPIEVVDKFVYLGSCISPGGLAKDDISIRIGKARAAFANLCQLWRRRDISFSVKGRVYNAAVRDSNPTFVPPLPLSRVGQPDSISALVLPSSSMADRHRKGVLHVNDFFTIPMMVETLISSIYRTTVYFIGQEEVIPAGHFILSKDRVCFDPVYVPPPCLLVAGLAGNGGELAECVRFSSLFCGTVFRLTLHCVQQSETAEDNKFTLICDPWIDLGDLHTLSGSEISPIANFVQSSIWPVVASVHQLPLD
ncbi:hypothetical protein T265_05990 [Opisthorchis viverrini]|uniref:Uncharacterized protein n=1 Tax=Opisthorchis viverrini TaxID=6198 RepID=A0A075AEM1_OPIVI|nr:hypothetical protein T265_05990 [Opisthorchis viverrini]KER26859.1 hypothetical protein T265_05990 [Opisthorchis viverrini]